MRRNRILGQVVLVEEGDNETRNICYVKTGTEFCSSLYIDVVQGINVNCRIIRFAND